MGICLGDPSVDQFRLALHAVEVVKRGSHPSCGIHTEPPTVFHLRDRDDVSWTLPAPRLPSNFRRSPLSGMGWQLRSFAPRRTVGSRPAGDGELEQPRCHLATRNE